MSKRRLALAIVVTSVLLVAVLVFAIQSSKPALIDPPEPDLAGVETQVAAKIGGLRDEVIRNLGSATAWGRYAMNLDAHNLTPEAIVAYRQAAALDRNEARWPYFCAIAMRGVHSSEAVEWFERARHIRPEYTPLLVRYAGSLADVGRFDDAANIYLSVLRIDRRSSQAHLGLAQLALARDQLDSSEIHLRQAIEINPRHGEAHGLLAEVYRRTGRQDEADLQVRRARQFVRSVPLADPVFVALVQEGASSHWFLRRGKSYMQYRMYDDARREFVAAYNVRPNAETRFHVGLAMQYVGEYDSAATQYTAALEERPNYVDALRNLAIVLVELGEVSEAIAAAERATRVDPTKAEIYLTLADIYGRSANAAKAVETLRSGAANAQYDYRIATQLAWYLSTAKSASLRNGEEAVRLAHDARDIVGGLDVKVLDALAAAYAEIGAFDKAVATALRARKLASASRQQELAEAIAARLSQYEIGQPFRGA